MKHLKKLSVAIMMVTLFSVTFTSCIDNEVSDAVDQVYLAQAELLQAQAALKEAEAQKALAEAAYENARAEYQLSLAAQQDAYTAGILITNAGMVETNAYNASRNVQILAEAQAKLEVVLQTQLVLLAEQERLYDIAMVNLAEAVAKAKDVLIVGYYGDYAYVTNMLQDLYEDRINAEHDLALKQLMLTAINSPVDLVSWAYYQSLLEADLADLEGQLAAKEAKLATLEAITPANASDTQKAITALEGQIAVLQEQYDALVIDHAETLNAQDQAYEAWQAETAKYNTLMDAENLYKAAVAAKKVHTDMIAATQTAKNLATANLTAAMASVDTTTAYNAVVAAKLDLTTKQGLVGTNYVTTVTLSDDPSVTSSPKIVAKAWDNVWNAELLAKKASATNDSVVKYTAPSVYFGGYPFTKINDLELDLVSALNAISPTLPASITAAQTIYNAALLAETAAQAAFNANPNGDTWVDGTDVSPTYPNSFIGDHTDIGVPTSYKRVATWQELPVSGSGVWYPLTYTTAATIPAIPIVVGFSEFDATTGINTVNKDATLGATPTLAYFVEVELDDTSSSNLWNLWYARLAAQTAEDNLLILQGSLTVSTQDAIDAQYLLNLGYTALGFTPPSNGDPLLSDWNITLALQTSALAAKNSAIAAIGYATLSGGTTITSPYSGAEMATAYYQVVLAEAAVVTALNALGTDFRPVADSNPFTSMYDQWWAATGTPATVSTYTVFGANAGIYQKLEGLISATVTGRIYTLPHVAPPALTAYQKLRNAYFQLVWAKESFAATTQVTYFSYLLDANYTASNANVIAQATKDLAALNALLPSHDYAIAYLLGEFTALAAEFNFDMTLWDLEGGHGLGQLLYNLPLYAAYLDAVKDTNAVIAEFSSVGTQIEDLENLIEAYAFLQNAYTFGGSSSNVTDFMETVDTDITNTKIAIDGLMEDIEIQKGLVATGIVDKAKAQAWVAEYERRLEVIETKITGFESAAANLLARITALLG